MGDALNQLHELEVYQLDHGAKPGVRGAGKRPASHKAPQDRRSEESDGDHNNDVAMFYEADAMGGSAGEHGSDRRDSQKSTSTPGKFHVPNLFKSLKTKKDGKK